MEESIVKCPHCSEYILIEKLNCGIFRHGVIKSTGMQMLSHEKKEICDYYRENKIIYGCGKPFQILNINNVYVIQICDYI